MNRLIPVLCSIILWTGCASLPLKQQAVTGLQASELALESAHDLERSLCFNSPATESGGHCTNPMAAALKLTDAAHQKIASAFSDAFAVEIKAATALKVWQAGQPAPTDVTTYQADVTAVLGLVQQLDTKAAGVISQTQQAVDSLAATLKALGVK